MLTQNVESDDATSSFTASFLGQLTEKVKTSSTKEVKDKPFFVGHGRTEHAHFVGHGRTEHAHFVHGRTENANFGQNLLLFASFFSFSKNKK